MTTVIHIKDAPQGWKSNRQYAYIGRPSKWGNPFTLEIYDRDTACDKYAQYIQSQEHLLYDIDELQHKILVCYCKPQRCHGDILAALADQVGSA